VIAIDNITFQGSSHPSLNTAENNATISRAVTASNGGNDANCPHYLLLPANPNMAHTAQQRCSSQHPISNYATQTLKTQADKTTTPSHFPPLGRTTASTLAALRVGRTRCTRIRKASSSQGVILKVPWTPWLGLRDRRGFRDVLWRR
jgi:hypothetical protein